MPLTCELGNHFGNANLNMTLNKSSNKKKFGIQLFTLHRIHISNMLFGFIGTLKETLV